MRTTLAVGMLCAFGAGLSAQTERASFDVADIKPSVGLRNGSSTQPFPGGRLHVENQPVRSLIRTAYRVQDFQISGGPAWINADRYDIEAKAEGNAPLPQVVGPMLQSLLADRFGLVIHRETRELPMYFLVAAKSGLKLEASKEPSGTIAVGPRMLEAKGVSMQEFAGSLSGIMERTVVDKTGFNQPFDAHLEFALEHGMLNGSTSLPPDPGRASISTVLQEQLGVRLQSAKGPVEVLVIDRIEKPGAN